MHRPATAPCGSRPSTSLSPNELRTYATAAITDLEGKAVLPSVPLPPGNYTVNAYFLAPTDANDVPTSIALGNGQSVTPTNNRFGPSTANATWTLAPTLESLRLDGSTGYANVAPAAGLNLTGDWTVESWFKDDNPK